MLTTYYYLGKKINVEGVSRTKTELLYYFRELGYCIRELDWNEYVCRTVDPIINIGITDSLLEDNIIILKWLICQNHFSINYNILNIKKKDSAYLCVKCRGVCMEPVVNSGEYLIVKKYRKTRIGCNSIILFCREGRLYLHRVMVVLVKKDNSYYITRGDNAILYDRLVSAEQIIGVVC